MQLGLVPLGALGLSVFGLDLYFASVGPMPAQLMETGLLFGEHFRILFDCLMLGLSGGIFVVPLFTLIQTRADRSHLSRIIGGMNILNALFMVMAALTAMVLLQAGLSVPEIFGATAAVNLVMLIVLCLKQPEYPRALWSWLAAMRRKPPREE